MGRARPNACSLECRTEDCSHVGSESFVVEIDLLIRVGGIAARSATVEASLWSRKRGLTLILVDKSAGWCAGALAMGLSAIHLYVDLDSGTITLRDVLDWVRNHLVGVTREDLVASVARHVGATVATKATLIVVAPRKSKSPTRRFSGRALARRRIL